MHCSRLLMSKYTSWECRIRTAVGFPLVLKTFQIYTFLISIIPCFIRSTNIFFLLVSKWASFTAVREKPWNKENREIQKIRLGVRSSNLYLLFPLWETFKQFLNIYNCTSIWNNWNGNVKRNYIWLIHLQWYKLLLIANCQTCCFI